MKSSSPSPRQQLQHQLPQTSHMESVSGSTKRTTSSKRTVTSSNAKKPVLVSREGDIERERLDITLVALSQKLALLAEMKEQAEQQRLHCQDVESKRDKLQSHLEQLTDKMQKDAK